MRLQVIHWITLKDVQPCPGAEQDENGDWWVEVGSLEDLILMSEKFDIMIRRRKDDELSLMLDQRGKYFRTR